MENDDNHDQFEERGGQGFSIGNSMVSLEGRSIITSGPCYNGDTAPVLPDNPERPGAYLASRKTFEAPVPIQGVSQPSLPPLPSKYLAKEAISRNHGRPIQRLKVLAPTVLLHIQIAPETLKTRHGIESVPVLLIRPPSSDLLYVCYYPLIKSDSAVFIFALAVSVKIRRSHQGVGHITFTS